MEEKIFQMNYMADKGLSFIGHEMLEKKKPAVLLHACCGPCATSCVERLAEDYTVTVYFYNPNITDKEEYAMRKDSLLSFIRDFNAENKGLYNIGFIEGEYNPKLFLEKTESLQEEPEGGRRCDVCFAMRLANTAKKAKELQMDYFTTSLSVSPHKNYAKIKTQCLMLEEQVGIEFLDIDFKKKNGFARSIELSKHYGLYRQNFCGCEYARYHGKDKADK